MLMRFSLLLAAAFVAGSSLCFADAHKVVTAQEASVLSGPVTEEMKGKTYMLEDGKLKKKDGKLNPKYFILYFSASWCGPCCQNAPHSVEAYNKVVKDNPDVEVIMCNQDDTLEAAEKWAVAHNMPWPILLRQDLTELAKKVAPRGIPNMILVDKDGKFIQRSKNMEILVNAISDFQGKGQTEK